VNEEPGPDSLAADSDAGVLKRRSVRGAAVTFAAQATRSVLQLGSQIVLAHLLAPAAFGLVAMVAPILNLVQVFNALGLTQATVQRAEITHGELSALFWINVVISACLAMAMALAAPLIAWAYGEPRLELVTICSASLLVLSGVSAQQIALMNRRMQFGPLAVIDIACLSVAVVVGIGAAWLGFGYWSLVLMQAANSLTVMVLAWAQSDWRPSRPRRQAGVGALLRFGGHLTAYNILGYIENNLSNILIGSFSGPVALGLYDRAFKLVIVPWWQVSLPIDRVAVALLSRLRTAEVHYIQAHQRMLQGLLLVAGPGLLWAALFSEQLVPILLGRDWSNAAPIVAALSLGAILMPFGACAYWLFVSQGRAREQFRYGCISAAAIIASMLLGIHWGPVGIARSYAGFAVVIQGALLLGATRKGPVTLRGVLLGVYPIMLGLLIAGIAVTAEQRLFDQGGTAVRLGAGLILSYAACAGGLLCTRPGLRIFRELWELRSTFRRLPALG